MQEFFFDMVFNACYLIFFFFFNVAMADLGHQGHLESDKHEETFKEIYDGFSFSVVCLSTFSPTHLGWLGSDRGVLTMCFYRCEFMFASMSKKKKKNTPLLKTDMTEQWLDP